MIRLDPIDQLPTFLLNQPNQSLAFCRNQIDHMAAPILALLLKPPLLPLLNSLRGILTIMEITMSIPPGQI